MKFLLGVLVGILVVVIGGFGFLKSGRFDVSASKSAGAVERRLADISLDAWVGHNAPKSANPRASDPAVLKQGIDHYKENCLVCHGVPGEKPSEIARGMNPPPPDLSSRDTQEMPDGQLFFIVSHGIRMTGMPSFSVTHQRDEIWAMVAFVRHLPQLTDAEKKDLSAGRQDEEEHHHEGAGTR